MALFEVSGPVLVLSTRMASAQEQVEGRSFLSLGKEPYLIPYNTSWPVVVDLPEGMVLRWKVWKAEKKQQEAVKL